MVLLKPVKPTAYQSIQHDRTDQCMLIKAQGPG